MTPTRNFAALGRGNGFPFCVTQRPYNASIHAGEYTLKQAMALVWNLIGFDLTVTTDTPNEYEPFVPVYGWNLENVEEIEPFRRVCNGSAQPDVGFDETSGKYHLRVPELFFSINSFSSSMGSGTGFGFGVSDGYGGSWGISSSVAGGETVIGATLDFNFYTYP